MIYPCFQEITFTGIVETLISLILLDTGITHFLPLRLRLLVFLLYHVCMGCKKSSITLVVERALEMEYCFMPLYVACFI